MSQAPIDWLKFVVLLNIPIIFITEDVSQVPIGWLNTVALLNINDILVTEDVSQVPIGWLNDAAATNIPPIFITDDVSHKSILLTVVSDVQPLKQASKVVVPFKSKISDTPLKSRFAQP